VTLTQFQNILQLDVKELAEPQSRISAALLEMLHWFAGKQIRNVASIAGNIMTGSPISDLNPIFMASGCTLTLQSGSLGTRQVKMDENFFIGYRRNIVAPDEVLIKIEIPRTQDDEYINGYKQSRRREDDIAIVNAGLRVLFHPGTSKVKNASIVFGGMAPVTVMAKKTMKKLMGRNWEDPSLVEDVCRWILDEIPLAPSVPGGMSSYRQSLCLSFFFKFHLKVLRELTLRSIIKDTIIPENFKNAESSIERGVFQGSQLFELVPRDQPKLDPVGRPVAHAAGEMHVTGKAIYCDDIPPVAGELHMALVLSNQAHAEIVSIDPTAALELEGVRGFFSAKDIAQERNKFGTVIHDEEVFASKEVTSCGQVLACVVADSLSLAQRASRLVKVTYRPINPIIVTIQDAIQHGSFYDEHNWKMSNGDVDAAMKDADHVVEGTFAMAGQEHFYLETNAVLVVPKAEEGELDITCSTQGPSEVQQIVSEVLGIPSNRVICRCKAL